MKAQEFGVLLSVITSILKIQINHPQKLILNTRIKQKSFDKDYLKVAQEQIIF